MNISSKINKVYFIGLELKGDELDDLLHSIEEADLEGYGSPVVSELIDGLRKVLDDETNTGHVKRVVSGWKP